MRGAPERARSWAAGPLQDSTKGVDGGVSDARSIEKRVRMPGEQPATGCQSVRIDLVVAGLDVDNDLSPNVLRRFHSRPDRLLVEFLPPAVDLFFRYPQRRHAR